MSILNDTSSHVLHIISNFHLFLKIFENTQWTKKASLETIKNSFKLSAFVEKVIVNLNSKAIAIQFLNLFKNWLWENEKRSMVYQVEFFECASDYILEILLFNKAITITSADIALRIYSSLYPAERFEMFLKCRVLKYSSYDVLLRTIIELSFHPVEIEAGMILKDWEKLMNEGSIESIKINIYEMFSNYRLNKTLPVLLKILCISENNDNINNIKEIIMERLQERLTDRSTLNKDFWIFIFQKLSPAILADVCSINNIIRDMIFNFIEYIGSMMNPVFTNSQKSWVPSNEYSLCPEITYNDLFKIIKAISMATNKSKEAILLKIREAQKNSISDLWDDILYSL